MNILNKHLFEYLFSIILDMYLRVKLLGLCVLGLCLTICRAVVLFPIVVIPFYILNISA